jgi:ribose transport system permease protein
MRFETRDSSLESAQEALQPPKVAKASHLHGTVRGLISHFIFRGLASWYGPWLILLVLFVICSFVSPAFLKERNVVNILKQATVLGIVSVGQTFVIISGGFDMSVSSVMSFCSVLPGMLMEGKNTMLVPSVLLAFALAIIVGCVNVFFVTKMRIHGFIVTLATMISLQGVLLITTGGAPFSRLTPAYRWFGIGQIGPMPVLVLIFLLVAVFGALLLRLSFFGRSLFAVGSNDQNAYLSGIPVARTRLWAYLLCSCSAALAGLVLTARTGSGDVWSGRDFDLNSIAAVAVGGTSLSGGRGGVVQTIAGVLILTILMNIMNLISVTYESSLVVRGAVIILAAINYSRKN